MAVTAGVGQWYLISNPASAACPTATYRSDDVSYAVTPANESTLTPNGTLRVRTAGTYTVTASVPGRGDCVRSCGRYQYVVNKAPATVRFMKAEPGAMWRGLGTYTNTAIVDGVAGCGAGTVDCPSGRVQYSSSDPSVTVVDGVVSFPTSGGDATVTITASYAGDVNYSATSGKYTLNISALPPAILTFRVPGPVLRAYGDTGWNLLSNPATASCSANVNYAPQVTYAITAQAPPTNGATVSDAGVLTLLEATGAGSYTVQASVPSGGGCVASGAEYSLDVLPSPPRLTFATNDVLATLGTQPTALAAALAPYVGCDQCAQPTGAITYSSSDPSVASIDTASSPQVTLKRGGYTAVSARSAKDANWSESDGADEYGLWVRSITSVAPASLSAGGAGPSDWTLAGTCLGANAAITTGNADLGTVRLNGTDCSKSGTIDRAYTVSAPANNLQHVDCRNVTVPSGTSVDITFSGDSTLRFSVPIR